MSKITKNKIIDIKKKIIKCWKNFCRSIKKHWIASSVVLTLSSWLSLFLTYSGEDTGLVKIIDNRRALSFSGWIISALFFILTILVVVAQKYNEKDNSTSKLYADLDKANSGYKLLDDILISKGKICSNKSNTQVKEISQIRSKKSEPKDVFTAPCEQLKNILNSMSECLSKMLSEKEHYVKEDDIYVSLAYNFPLENSDSWHWSENKQEKGMLLEDLLSNDNTTFSKLLKSNQRFIFYNSKQKAAEDKCYVPDDNDQSPGGKLRGSIACYKINVIHNDKTYIRAILSISTYDKCFSKVADKKSIQNISDNMNNHIISNFEKEIRVELCNYYMQFLYERMNEEIKESH